MVENREKTSAPWKAIAEMWNTYFTSPSRISEDESDKYGEWLSYYADESKKVLLLGVTPEIRDILAEIGCKVTCVDINEEMIAAMNSLKEAENPDEEVINENWLDNSLEKNNFDIVIGDAVLPNVNWEDREELLSEVKRVLKAEGLFITRAFCVPVEKRFENIHELLEEFSNKKPNYKSALELVLELQFLAYDPQDHLGTFTEPKKMLKEIRSEKGFDFESENLNKILDIVW